VEDGPLSGGFGDDGLDAVPLCTGGQGAHLGIVVQRIADPDGLGPPDQLGDELVVDPRLHEDPAASYAALAGCAEVPGHRPVYGTIQISVVKDQDR
jgi:hypothetical protein